MNRLALVLALAAGVPAQSFFVPDSDAANGNCNTFPFGSTGGLNLKYQMLVPAASIGQAGRITGLGFAQCGEGVHHFDSIQIRLDHRAASTLTSTFAQNITANAVTVLASTNYDWNLPANSWRDVGLQHPFDYDGVDNLVIEVIATGSQWTQGPVLGSPGLRAWNGTRVWASGWTTSPPATGTVSNTFALKVEIDMGVAKVSSHGRGCLGSNGQAPTASATGAPVLGQAMSVQVAGALPGAAALSVYGFDNGAPYPIDLTALGMTGCRLYQAVAAIGFALCDGSGGATAPLAIPADPQLIGLPLWWQWGCGDPAANAPGLVTSNFLRLQLGL